MASFPATVPIRLNSKEGFKFFCDSGNPSSFGPSDSRRKSSSQENGFEGATRDSSDTGLATGFICTTPKSPHLSVWTGVLTRQFSFVAVRIIFLQPGYFSLSSLGLV